MDNKYKNKVAKINKALYGLKQSLRLFYQFIIDIFINKLGFSIILFNKGIYINKINKIIINYYIDDLLIAYLNKPTLKSFIKKALKYLKLEDLKGIINLGGMNRRIVCRVAAACRRVGYQNDALDQSYPMIRPRKVEI